MTKLTLTSGLCCVLVVTAVGLMTTAQAGLTTNTLNLTPGLEPTLNGSGLGGTYTGVTDLYVDVTQPDSTIDGTDTVRFGLWTKDGSAGTRGYIRFEDLTTYLPAGAVIVDARLSLTSAGTDGGTSYHSTASYRTATFDGLTWNTAGTVASNAVSVGSVGSWNAVWAADDVQTIPITDLVQQWYQGGLTNHGLQFNAFQENTSWDGVGKQFYSSEYATDTGKRPNLEIDYIDPAAESGKPFPSAPDLTYTTRVEVLRGGSVTADTYVDLVNPDTNYASAASTNLSSWWGINPTKRGLMELDLTHSTLASIAQTGDIDFGNVILKGATLQLHADGAPGFYIDLLRMASDWDVDTATGNTYDGSNAWPDGSMVGSVPTNVIKPLIASDAYDDIAGGTTLSFDITDLLQAWIDGTLPNYGFMLAQDANNTNFSNQVMLTEYGIEWMRPTLILELQVLSVPEPATAITLALAGLMVIWRKR